MITYTDLINFGLSEIKAPNLDRNWYWFRIGYEGNLFLHKKTNEIHIRHMDDNDGKDREYGVVESFEKLVNILHKLEYLDENDKKNSLIERKILY